MDEDAADPLAGVRDLPGFDRGSPLYFADPMIDRLMTIVLQLGAELWVTRDRQMIVEHLLATEGRVTPQMIEQFKPSPQMAEAQRDARRALAKSLYGGLYEDLAPAATAFRR